MFNIIRNCQSLAFDIVTSRVWVPVAQLSLTLGMIYLFSLRYSNRYRVVSHCGFNLPFCNNYWFWAHLIYLFLYVFFSCLYESLAYVLIRLFVSLLLSSDSAYVIWIQILYHICDLQIFFPSWWIVLPSLNNVFPKKSVEVLKMTLWEVRQRTPLKTTNNMKT